MTEKEKALIPLIHCLAVAINTAEAIRLKVQGTNKMPKHQLKKDLNKSMNALDLLQNVEIQEKDKKVNLLDIFFSDDKQVVNLHTNDLLSKLEYNTDTYIALTLVIASVLSRLESSFRNAQRKNPEFWHYMEKVLFPMQAYFNKKGIESISTKIIDGVTEAIQ